MLLQMTGVIGTGLIVNRVYYATKENTIQIYSTVGNRDWFECKWFTTPKKNTRNFKREFYLIKNATLFLNILFFNDRV
jgi:hypothetical protein